MIAQSSCPQTRRTVIVQPRWWICHWCSVQQFYSLVLQLRAQVSEHKSRYRTIGWQVLQMISFAKQSDVLKAKDDSIIKIVRRRVSIPWTQNCIKNKNTSILYGSYYKLAVLVSKFFSSFYCYLKGCHQILPWCRFLVQKVNAVPPESKINVPLFDLGAWPSFTLHRQLIMIAL